MAKKITVDQPIDEEVISSKFVTVKNISGRTIFLESGRLYAGDKGMATRAELSNLYRFIEAVD